MFPVKFIYDSLKSFIMNIENIPEILTYGVAGASGLGILYAGLRFRKNAYELNKKNAKFISQIKALDSFKNLERFFDFEVFLSRSNKENETVFEVNPENPAVLWLPHNDEVGTFPNNYYSQGQLIITNSNDFTEVKNISELLHQVTDTMVEGYESKVPIFSTENFGIKLVDKLTKNYSGNGELIYFMLNLDIRALSEAKRATNFCTNQFLDVFMGWNYGDLIRSDSKLEEKLQSLNSKLLSDGNRNSEKMTGFHVTYRTTDTTIDNHYSFELAD